MLPSEHRKGFNGATAPLLPLLLPPPPRPTPAPLPLPPTTSAVASKSLARTGAESGTQVCLVLEVSSFLGCLLPLTFLLCTVVPRIDLLSPLDGELWGGGSPLRVTSCLLCPGLVQQMLSDDPAGKTLLRGMCWL